MSERLKSTLLFTVLVGFNVVAIATRHDLGLRWINLVSLIVCAWCWGSVWTMLRAR